MPIELTCEECNKSYEVKPSRADKSRFCSRKCYELFWVREGICQHTQKHSEDSKKKMKESLKGRTPWNKGETHKKIRGENHHNWKGGKFKRFCINCGEEFFVFPYNKKKYCSQECFVEHYDFPERRKHHNWVENRRLNLHIRGSKQNIRWRRQVFERDDFTCQVCGKKSGNGVRVILNAHHIMKFSEVIDQNNITSIEEADKCKKLWDVGNGVTLCRECHLQEHFGDLYEK